MAPKKEGFNDACVVAVGSLLPNRYICKHIE